MLKKILSFALVLVASFSLFACGGDNTPGGGGGNGDFAVTITLEEDSYELDLNGTKTFKLNAEASDESRVRFKSLDTSVASVTSSGTVTAKAVGTVDILAYTGTSSTHTGEAICEVTVIDSSSDDPSQGVVTITFAQSSFEVVEGNSISVKATASNGGVVLYESSRQEVATVDSYGRVTAVAVGTTTITAVLEEDPTVTKSCTVTVVEESDAPPVEPSEGDKIQIFVHNFAGGYGSVWIGKLNERFEAEMASYTDETNFPGKKGVQVILTTEKVSIMGLADKIPGGKFDLYFSEYADYYTLTSKGQAGDITEAVTTPIGFEGETESIVDKLTAEQRSYFGIKDTETQEIEYLGLPHYAGYAGINYDKGLFDERGLYFYADYKFDLENVRNGDPVDYLFVTGPSDPKSVGPDGQAGTEDDGLPTTYEEFFYLCEYIESMGFTALDYTGQYRADYLTYMLGALSSNIDGLTDSMLNYNLTGTAKTLGSVVNGEFVIDSEPTEITYENGYELARQAGRYYSIDFMKKLFDGKHYGPKSNASIYSHLDAQKNFILGKHDNVTYKRTAMLIEGCWWENEANAAFAYAEQTWGAKKSDRQFSIMPLPLPTEEMAEARANGETKRTLFDMINSICLMKPGLTNDPRLDIIYDYIKFAHTDKSLIEYSENTNTMKAFDYDMSESQLEKLTYYGRSIYNAKKSSDVVVPNASHPFFISNFGKLSYTSRFTAEIDGGVYAHPHVKIYEDKNLTVEQYFNGMVNYLEKEWNNMNVPESLA